MIACSEYSAAFGNIAARRQQNDPAVGVGSAKDQHFGNEAGDVARREIANADHQRAGQRLRRIVGNLRARPFVTEIAKIDPDFPRRIARFRKRLYLDNASNTHVNARKIDLL